MTPKLSQELTDALHAAGDKPLSVVDPTTNHVYLVVDPAKPQQAIEALRREEDSQALREGIADADAGRMKPLDEAFDGVERKLFSPPAE